MICFFSRCVRCSSTGIARPANATKNRGARNCICLLEPSNPPSPLYAATARPALRAGLRTLEPSNPRTLEPSNPRTLEPLFLLRVLIRGAGEQTLPVRERDTACVGGVRAVPRLPAVDDQDRAGGQVLLAPAAAEERIGAA